MTDLHQQNWRTSIIEVKDIGFHKFIEVEKNNFETELTIINKVENDVYELNLSNQNMNGHWIGKLQQLSDGRVKLEMTHSITMKKKMLPFLVKTYIKQQQNHYMNDLRKALSNSD